jgi:hypothetical protein
MTEQEDLEFNVFFSTLQKRFPKTYERAQESCLLICIPQSKALVNFRPTQQMFERHIFQPSPLFKNEWDSISKPSIKIHLPEGQSLLQVTLPTGEKLSVKVLFEEKHYNSSFQPFKILCLDYFIDEKAPPPPPSTAKKSAPGIFEQRSTYRENETFLKSFTSAMGPLNDRTSLFNTGYVIVPGFLEHMAERLMNMRDEIAEIAMRSSALAAARSDSRLPDTVNEAIECCMLEKVWVRCHVLTPRCTKRRLGRSSPRRARPVASSKLLPSAVFALAASIPLGRSRSAILSLQSPLCVP